MSIIKPHLWFNTQAREAAEFYTSLLPNSAVDNVTVINDTPSGDCDLVSFTLAGQPFMAISAGPLFKFNPSISFMINFDPSMDADAATHIDEVWNKLTKGGNIMMPLGEYPFSKRYGWVSDKYGVSWQLILTNPAGEPRPVIIPSMMFTGDVAGKATEAIDFYCSVFNDGKRGNLALRQEDMGPDKAGTLLFGDFHIGKTWVAAMDSAHNHGFAFNEAVSLLIACETQEEIDHYWSALSAYPTAEQCGWLKDKYGVSWQVAPTLMDEMMRTGTPEQIARVTQAFMPMKKFDIAALQRAFNGV